jgi:hypothetical protein
VKREWKSTGREKRAGEESGRREREKRVKRVKRREESDRREMQEIEAKKIMERHKFARTARIAHLDEPPVNENEWGCVDESERRKMRV